MPTRVRGSGTSGLWYVRGRDGCAYCPSESSIKTVTVVSSDQDTGVRVESEGVRRERAHDHVAQSAAPVCRCGFDLVDDPECVGGREPAGRGDLPLKVENDSGDNIAGGLKPCGVRRWRSCVGIGPVGRRHEVAGVGQLPLWRESGTGAHITRVPRAVARG